MSVQVINANTGQPLLAGDFTIEVDYIYLDSYERDQFAKHDFNYLIIDPKIQIRSFIYQRILFHRLYNTGYPISIMVEIAEHTWNAFIVNKFRWYLLGKRGNKK